MCADVLAQRSFSQDDQAWFAKLSGDYNPIHVDDLAARRSLFGRTVVHGVHVSLWALDALCASKNVSPRRIVATFSKPVFVNEPLTAEIEDLDSTHQINITVDKTPVMTFTVYDGDMKISATPDSYVATARTAPRDLAIEDMKGMTGELPNSAPHPSWTAAFPDLAAVTSQECVAELASLSRLVGMECPGLHSLFAGFDVSLGHQSNVSGLQYAVTRADSRFSAVRISVESPVLRGTINAFARPRPTVQAFTKELIERTRPREFAAMKALIVGGSRGLGELTAKLIAAGGGEVIVTWNHGRSDAEKVANDIQSAGRKASTLQLDVGKVNEMPQPITHLFYFASPRISSRRLSDFDDKQYDDFKQVYVKGFMNVANACVDAGNEKLSVFYPSTVYVDEMPTDMIEYATAKRDGETAANSWASDHPSATVVVERLPRLATDQTASFTEEDFEDSTSILLQMIRRCLKTRDSQL